MSESFSGVHLTTIEVNPEVSPTTSIIWLHGLGADGSDFLPLIERLQFPEDHSVKFIFPNAPRRPITVNQGIQMKAWYDIFHLSFDKSSKEDEAGIKATYQLIKQLIDQEISKGIPASKILLGGFSQGGAMVLYMGLRLEYSLMGIIGLSTYLPLMDTTDMEASEANLNTPILMAHGLYDSIVPYSIGKMSAQYLKKLDYSVEWKEYAMDHSVNEQEMLDIGQFIKEILN